MLEIVWKRIKCCAEVSSNPHSVVMGGLVMQDSLGSRVSGSMNLGAGMMLHPGFVPY